jgi:AP-1 complex subunit beta-1
MAMTLGKDVSALFPDVLKNIATADLDQKKLVYLYLMFDLYSDRRLLKANSATGITPNPIPISAFSLSTLSFKIQKTQTL